MEADDRGEETDTASRYWVARHFRRLPKVSAFLYGLATFLLDSTVVVAVAAALGLKLTGHSPQAVALLVLAGWALVAAVVVAAYVDDHDLRKCAEAWPRMRQPEYRPARSAHVTNPLRSPVPAALLVLATIAAALGIASILLHAEKPARNLPQAAWIGAYASLGIAALVFLPAMWNARKSRRDYRREYRNRKPEFSAAQATGGGMVSSALARRATPDSALLNLPVPEGWLRRCAPARSAVIPRPGGIDGDVVPIGVPSRVVRAVAGSWSRIPAIPRTRSSA